MLESSAADQMDLLYPFYLDTDMSMAFSAALTGGVALEEEHVGHAEESSNALRSLRGTLRLFSAVGIDGGRERTELSGSATESRMIRRHTVDSVFIALYDELRRTGRLIEDPDFSELRVGSLVSFQSGPAIAPLRRVIDQILRLFDVLEPIVGAETETSSAQVTVPASRQDRRQREREAAKAAGVSNTQGTSELNGLRGLFGALRDDLDRSGMVDIVVNREDAPSVVLTLDKQFAGDAALELLHTSGFTVVGKVTQIWPTEEDVVNLYRRSVLSLLPSLAQGMAWGVFTLLITMAKGVGAADLEKQARDALGLPVDEFPGGAEPLEAASAEQSGEEVGDGDPGATEPGDVNDDETDDDIRVGDDVAALHPAMVGPAFQILPLAICA